MSVKLKIPKISVGMDDSEYWRRYSYYPPRPDGVMPKPCFDCGVATGFYGEIVERLELQPRDIQIKNALSWFCHNAPNKSCRGVCDYLKIETPK